MTKSRLAVVMAGSLVAAAGMARAAGEPGLQVRLRYASFDPLIGEPMVPPLLHAGGGCGVFLVQFHDTPAPWMRQQIEDRGGRVERFLTDNTHVVRIAGPDQISRLPHVRWVGPYHLAYRLQPEIAAELAAGGLDGSDARYSIEPFRAEAGAIVAEQIKRVGGLVELITPQGRIEATLSPRQLLEVVRGDEVNYIDRAGPAGADMDLVRQLVGAAPALSNAGFRGQGVRGEVWDTGLDEAHPDFQNPPPLLHCPGSTPTGDQHGTAIYGIVFGNGAGNSAATGLLPEREQGIFCRYDFLTSTPFQQFAELTDPLGPYRAVFQTRAVGSAQTTAYTTISAEMDHALFLYDLLVTQSQGSEAAPSSRPQAWAKNIVAVGGVMHQDTLTRADDSGGFATQAADGRVKPDLVGVRDNVLAAAPGAAYTNFAGSSAATAIVAGSFGLVFQMWHQGVWAGFGGGSSVFDSKPKASTARALVINSAFQYDWTAGGPNGTITRRVQGWGMPDLEGLYEARHKTFIINETDPLTPLQVRRYTLTVGAGEPMLKATMVYLDPPGNPAAMQARINDLTLRVTAPDGTVYWGNNGLLSGLWSVPNGSPDFVNTVENVFIPNPAAGEWNVDVIGYQIVQDARLETPELDADYALVVSGVVLSGQCYANCDGSTVEPVLNVADFACFLQKFAAGDPYANCDGSTQPPVLNVADFGCFLQAFAGGCR